MSTTPCVPCCTTPQSVDIPGPEGLNAFTFTTADFIVPALGNQVTISVQDSSFMAIGQTVFVQGAGYFTVIAKPTEQSVTLEYQNIALNTSAGNTITTGAEVSPAATATDGTNGQDAFTVTTADFVVPAISGSVSIAVANSQWLAVGQNFFVENAGYFIVTSKADATHVTGTYLDVAANTNAGNTAPAGSEVSAAGPDLANPLTVSRGGTGSATATAARAALGIGGASLTVYASGTAYSLTNVSTALDFGTTDPVLVITSPGTWLILARIRVDYNGATFAAVRTGTLKLRRTNNTAADLTNGSVGFRTDVITTLTYTLGEFSKALIYVTTNSDDSLTVFGDISVAPTAGSLDCVEADIIAIKLFDQTV